MTVPSRNVVFDSAFDKRLLQVNTTRMAYSSWKFHWIYHSQSTVILRTGSSSSTKVSMMASIVMTPMHLLQLAKRAPPAGIGADLLNAKCTMLILDIVKMELEAKAPQLTILWNDADDAFVIKYGTQTIVPKYDSLRKLLPSFAHSDICFTFA